MGIGKVTQAGSEGWLGDMSTARLSRVALYGLFGAIGGGALAIFGLPSVPPLAKALKGRGPRIAFQVASAAVGGLCAGSITLYFTRSRAKSADQPQDQSAPSQSSDSSSSASSSQTSDNTSFSNSTTSEQESSPRTASETASASIEGGNPDSPLEERWNEILESANWKSRKGAKEGGKQLAKLYEQAGSGDASRAAKWLTQGDHRQSLMEEVPISIRGARPSAAKSVVTRLQTSVGFLKKGTPQRYSTLSVVKKYDALAALLGEELTAGLVGDTFPVQARNKQLRREVIENPELWRTALDVMGLPQTTQSMKIIETRMEDLWKEGSLHEDFVEGLEDAYGELVESVGGVAKASEIVDEITKQVFTSVYEADNAKFYLEQIKGKVAGKNPVSFTYSAREGAKARFDEAVCEEISRAYQIFTKAPGRQSSLTRGQVREKHFSELGKLEGDQRWEGVASPFSRELWRLCFSRVNCVKQLKEWKGEIEGEEKKLSKETLSQVQRTTRDGSGEEVKQGWAVDAERILRREVATAVANLPKGYGAPLNRVADQLCSLWQQLGLIAEAAQQEKGAWGAREKQAYDAVRQATYDRLRELQLVMEVTEEQIGIEANLCDLMIAAVDRIVRGGDRLELQRLGEELRMFYCHRRPPLAEQVQAHGEGVMPQWFAEFRSLMARESVGHRSLRLCSGDERAPKGWVPVAVGLTTHAASGKRAKKTRKSNGYHFVPYVRTDKRTFSCLDNLRPSPPATAKGKEKAKGKEQSDVSTKPVKELKTAVSKNRADCAVVYVRPKERTRALEALQEAATWSTLQFATEDGRATNNCFISTALVLLAAYYKVGNQLDAKAFRFPKGSPVGDRDSSSGL